jgi:hypothetical protein
MIILQQMDMPMAEMSAPAGRPAGLVAIFSTVYRSRGVQHSDDERDDQMEGGIPIAVSTRPR